MIYYIRIVLSNIDKLNVNKKCYDRLGCYRYVVSGCNIYRISNHYGDILGAY